jgi:dihydrofolate reductase
MGTITVTEFISIDGVIESPGGEPGYAHSGWTFAFTDANGRPWFDDPRAGAFKNDELQAAEAQLLGRTTYESFAGAWPEREGPDDEGGFAAKMNAMPKYVVSSTLRDPEWNNTTVVGSDVAAAVASVKEKHDGSILVAGSRTLARELLRRDLVDELRLMVFPVVLGSGRRLFPEDAPHARTLSLIDCDVLASGMLLQRWGRRA